MVTLKLILVAVVSDQGRQDYVITPNWVMCIDRKYKNAVLSTMGFFAAVDRRTDCNT